jgi:sigma-B regulation protein RsbU (phosphoserine phosphatase)
MQPVFRSGATGEARLLETAGDRLPLGILDEADYQESRFQLLPGDAVVLYTDGVVEVVNERQEMFGFERLLRLTGEDGHSSARSLLDRIAEAVQAFVGSSSPRDDLTLIVIKARN